MKKIKFSVSVLITIFSSFSFASADFSCPTHIDILKPLANLSTEWVAYNNPLYTPSKSNILKSGDLLGIDLNVGTREPFEPLGGMIPNNDSTGFEDGFWLWLLEGQQISNWEVNIVCNFQGTDVVLINTVKIPVKECRNPIKNRKSTNLIKCK